MKHHFPGFKCQKTWQRQLTSGNSFMLYLFMPLVRATAGFKPLKFGL